MLSRLKLKKSEKCNNCHYKIVENSEPCDDCKFNKLLGGINNYLNHDYELIRLRNEELEESRSKIKKKPYDKKELFVNKEVGSDDIKEIECLKIDNEIRQAILNNIECIKNREVADILVETYNIPFAELSVPKDLFKEEDELIQFAKEEQERLEQERLEQERLEHERLRQERLEHERLREERLEHERLRQERLKQERLKQERLEQERLEQERLRQERLEQERIEAEKQAFENAVYISEAEQDYQYYNIQEEIQNEIDSLRYVRNAAMDELELQYHRDKALLDKYIPKKVLTSNMEMYELEITVPCAKKVEEVPRVEAKQKNKLLFSDYNLKELKQYDKYGFPINVELHYTLERLNVKIDRDIKDIRDLKLQKTSSFDVSELNEVLSMSNNNTKDQRDRRIRTDRILEEDRRVSDNRNVPKNKKVKKVSGWNDFDVNNW